MGLQIPGKVGKIGRLVCIKLSDEHLYQCGDHPIDKLGYILLHFSIKVFFKSTKACIQHIFNLKEE